MAEMDGEEGVTATALEARKNERTRMRKISKLQRVAQEWVEAAWTEILVLLLVLLDLSLTIYELVADLDEYADYEAYKNPMNVVTGSILFVFAFEVCVRPRSLALSLALLHSLTLSLPLSLSHLSLLSPPPSPSSSAPPSVTHATDVCVCVCVRVPGEQAGVRLYGFRIMLFYRVLDVIDLMVCATAPPRMAALRPETAALHPETAAPPA
eukprot:1182750-Rhodomonas_salina.2